ncbi:MAG TPA: glycosyl hydrolase 115 family protein [Bacteroidales bacterium]|nr:glycosyl hydrolase 115 family protein [Bacteroidales bacterium]
MRIPILLILFCLTTTVFANSNEFVLAANQKACPILLVNPTNPARQAASMLAGDVLAVAGVIPNVSEDLTMLKKADYSVLAGIPGTNKTFDTLLKKHKIEVVNLKGAWEAYRIQSVSYRNKNILFVVGSDALGTAYGLLEISRQIGVSPWIWWADATPAQKSRVALPAGFQKEDKPAVQFRGIFLNDEDWGLMPWATETLDPKSAKGAIGPGAYERICQLLLRLRANIVWPAMHDCTAAFYTVPGNAEMAAKYGIFVGTSHCEPLMRNNVGEWDHSSLGEYDYTVNAANVKQYWADRVQATTTTPCVYTVGMRGIHDGKMEGAKTIADQRNLLEKVFEDQRQILSSKLKKPIYKIPQVFIPYKEVMDVYDSGLKVPDDVTLMWCDDNYGNMTRSSSLEEQKRSGGAGVYYHLSYWGRPHDYLWLSTTSPAQIQFEMSRVWEQNVRKIWIVNVGDIKPCEYLSEYYLDMAWNIGKPAKPAVASLKEPAYADHLQSFMQREFSAEYAVHLSHILQTFYHLANQRKPEFMGWSRVEEAGAPGGKTPVIDTEFNKEEAEARIQAYATIEGQVRSINETLTRAKRASFFELVYYPVVAASMHNQKILYAQLARQADAANLTETAATYAAASLYAYQEIKKLTAIYNTQLNGKWNKIMSDHPRDLNVFKEPVLPERLRNVEPKSILQSSVVLRNATTTNLQEANQRVSFPASIARPDARPSGLGHSLSAIRLKKGDELNYTFTTISGGIAELCICTLPNYALDGGALRYEIVLNDGNPIRINTQTQGRSEAWKIRVLRNQSVVRIKLNDLKPGVQHMKLIALDDDVMPDQIMLDFNPDRKSYLLPGIPLIQ